MLELICKRLLLAIPTLLLVSMMVFGLQKLLPGDPLIAMAGEERDPAVIAQLRAELNLDAPIPVQYFNWLTRALSALDVQIVALVDIRTCDCFPALREALEAYADRTIYLPLDEDMEVLRGWA